HDGDDRLLDVALVAGALPPQEAQEGRLVGVVDRPVDPLEERLESVEALVGAPEGEGAAGARLDEEEGEVGRQASAGPVDPDLDRPEEELAARRQGVGRLAVEEEGARAVLLEAAVARADLVEPRLPGLFELVEGRRRVGVARLPPLAD